MGQEWTRMDKYRLELSRIIKNFPPAMPEEYNCILSYCHFGIFSLKLMHTKAPAANNLILET
jgi:hypothetical protein